MREKRFSTEKKEVYLEYNPETDKVSLPFLPMARITISKGTIPKRYHSQREAHNSAASQE